MSDTGFPVASQHAHKPLFEEPSHEDLYPPLPPRRRRGGLEEDIKAAIYAILDNEIPHPDGPLTPYRLSCIVRDRADTKHRPSTGGCTDVLKRWVKIGACEVQKKPYAFLNWTADGIMFSLEELHARAKQSAA